MARRFIRLYAKTVTRAVVKSVKGCVTDIINDINVNSLKKYKYNFLFEFLGSFTFAFFISIYMLHSNYNEEYVIRHATQINPYKNSEIFIPRENLFSDSVNDFVYTVENENEKPIYGNVLLEEPEKETVREDERKTERETAEDSTKHNETVKESDGKEENLQTNTQSEKNDATNNGISDEKNTEGEKGAVENMQSLEDKKKKEETERGFNNNEQNETGAHVKARTDFKEKEHLVKDVEVVIFNDELNKYSKIKIDDINSINLEHINNYNIINNEKTNINGTHVIYTVFGCLIYVLFVVLGAHINPAYTYALWFLEPKKYGFFLSSLYVFFQYVGGILASMLCAHIYGSIFIYSLLPRKRIMKTFMCESLCTFIMTLLLINLHQYKKRNIKENKEDDIEYNATQKIKNMPLPVNLYNNIYDCNMLSAGKKKNDVFFQIKNKYITYVLNNIFYVLFIFFALLFFVLVTNTTLNPMLSTSALYTYMYFKLFRGSQSFSLYSMLLSFLSFQRILQIIVLYIQSVPFWIGPYVGSTAASYLICVLKNEDEEVINVIDTNVYRSNRKREEMPLVYKGYFQDNAYLMEHNDNISQNVHTYATPAVF